MTAVALGACGPDDREPPTPYGDLVVRRAPPPHASKPADPAPEPPADRAPDFPPPTQVEPAVGPDDPGLAPPMGAPEILPPAWPRDTGAVVATAFSRRVVFGEQVVGVVPARDGGGLAISATGGVFRAERIGGWAPLRTPLPPPVTRAIAVGGVTVACTPAVPQARFTPDGGRSWTRLGFNCAPAGERTVAEAGGRIYALLPDGTLRVGELTRDAGERRALPLDAPEAIGAFDRAVVVFGERGVIYSDDFGESFHVGRRPAPRVLRAVRDVVFIGKGVVVAVGRAEPGGASVLISRDAGATWAPPARLPRRADDLAAAAVGPGGRVVAVPRGAGEGLQSLDAGRTWQPLLGEVAYADAIAAAGPGFLAGSARGLVRGLDAPSPAALGVERPLWDAVFTHPRVAIAAGMDGGLYRSTDGGRTWARLAGTAAVRFWGLDSPGGHTVVAVGDGVLWRGDASHTRRFDQGTAPVSCEARWVRFRPGGPVAVVGCQNGVLLRTDDEGRTWGVAAELPEALRAAVFTSNGRAGALSGDGRTIYASEDDGNSWSPALRLDAIDAVELAAGPDGPVMLTADGGLLAAPDFSGPWAPVAAGQVRAPRGLLVAADGRRLVVGDDALHLLLPGAPARRLATIPGARRVVPTGDGGLLALQDAATTLLEPR